MTWDDWLGWFLTLVGAGEWIDATAASWVRDLFVPGGVTPAEAKEAALAVARDGLPTKPGEILRALVDELKRMRAAELHAREEQERQSQPVVGPGRCRDCGGSGLASVPQRPEPPEARGGLVECYVCCSCAAGLRTGLLRDHRDRPLMTLADYEQINPDWREELAFRRGEQLARARVEGSYGAEWEAMIDRMAKAAKGRARR